MELRVYSVPASEAMGQGLSSGAAFHVLEALAGQ